MSDLVTYTTDNPGAVYAFHVLASCLISLEQYKAAIDAENRAIELDPNNAEYYYFRGVALHRMDEIEAALNDVSKSIELNPDDERAHRLHDVLSVKLDENAE